MKIRIIAGVVMTVLAIIGMTLIGNYVGDADARALDNQHPRDVYLVTAPIAQGTPVEELGEFVERQTVPAVIVPDDAVTDLTDYKGKVAGVNLEPGEQLLGSRLVDLQALEAPGTVPVPKGMQEVTVQLDAPRVVGGQIQAGDTVGVFASFEGEGSREAKTSQDLHNVLVTSVQGAPSAISSTDETATTGGNGPAVPENTMLITLAVKADTAEKVVYASEFGRIWLSLESEDAEQNDNGATRGDFE
jgi:pilus assembly protein CpaB